MSRLQLINFAAPPMQPPMYYPQPPAYYPPQPMYMQQPQRRGMSTGGKIALGLGGLALATTAAAAYSGKGNITQGFQNMGNLITGKGTFKDKWGKAFGKDRTVTQVGKNAGKGWQFGFGSHQANKAKQDVIATGNSNYVDKDGNLTEKGSKLANKWKKDYVRSNNGDYEVTQEAIDRRKNNEVIEKFKAENPNKGYYDKTGKLTEEGQKALKLYRKELKAKNNSPVTPPSKPENTESPQVQPKPTDEQPKPQPPSKPEAEAPKKATLSDYINKQNGQISYDSLIQAGYSPNEVKNYLTRSKNPNVITGELPPDLQKVVQDRQPQSPASNPQQLVVQQATPPASTQQVQTQAQPPQGQSGVNLWGRNKVSSLFKNLRDDKLSEKQSDYLYKTIIPRLKELKGVTDVEKRRAAIKEIMGKTNDSVKDNSGTYNFLLSKLPDDIKKDLPEAFSRHTTRLLDARDFIAFSEAIRLRNYARRYI